MKVGVIFYHKNITKLYPQNWIDQCVNSILYQSYDDFVIYELNYGDDQFKICKKYDIDKEYHFYNDKFDNHAEAMNFLLKKAIHDGCDAIFNTNMDDNYHVDRFKMQLEYIRNGYDIISSNFIHIDENNKEIRKMNFSKENISKNLKINHNIIAHPVVCYSKRYIEANLYNPMEIPYEDMLLWKRTCDKYKFHICDEYLLNYRIHTNQVSNPNVVKKVGVLLIATNKYIDFVDEFILSADKYFLKDQEVTYFLFTNKEVKIQSKRNIINIKIKHREWPWMTLGRYKIFNRNSEILSNMDYLYYCDIDMKFVSTVGNEILGDRVVTKHPGFYNTFGTPEKNPKSSAYIHPDIKFEYFAGGFNGGTYIEFMKMSSLLSKNIDKDYKKGIIAIWHDESHLNRYMVDNKPIIILSPSYCYPDGSDIPFEKKLIALTKDHLLYRGNHLGLTNTLINSVPLPIVKEKEVELITIPHVINITNIKCRCGEIIDKRKFNYCQRCGKIY